ncbi:MAG: hypothetical protein BGO49_17445 [Planctomycetales bacterium 71-10]|nr:MAG: hypothetical protein BGO49_17445 [Planctomycetales bacterium 71-10]
MIAARPEIPATKRQDEPATPMEAMPFDALIVPESWKTGGTQLDRIDSILRLAEPLLGVDRSRGDRAYIRRQPGGRLFITKDPRDTISFPIGHPREGRPRYAWAASPDGSERGTLAEEPPHA